MSPEEFQLLINAIDRSLSQFRETPIEPGFDRDVYEELRRAREALLRARRDRRDPNIKRDSRSPLGSA